MAFKPWTLRQSWRDVKTYGPRAPMWLYQHFLAAWESGSVRQKASGSMRIAGHIRMAPTRSGFVFTMAGRKIYQINKQSQGVVYPAPIASTTLSAAYRFLTGEGCSSRSPLLHYGSSFERVNGMWVNKTTDLPVPLTGPIHVNMAVKYARDRLEN